MPKTKLQKQADVLKLEEKLSRAKAVVFTDYKGMTMKQLSGLRNKLYDQQAEFTITKNTLLGIALGKDKGLADDLLEGPTATLMAFDDQISPIKTLVKSLKDGGIGKVKGGLLGAQYLDAAKVNQLSTLPSKDELRGKTVGVLAAPLYGIVGVLQANLRNLVYALDQIRVSRGGE